MDNKILNHIRNIKLIQALYQGKKFFVQCYPTDNGAECFPNTNFAVKEIELPSFELTQEKEGYKWVSEKEISEHATNEVNRTLGELVEWMEECSSITDSRVMKSAFNICVDKAKSLLKQEGELRPLRPLSDMTEEERGYLMEVANLEPEDLDVLNGGTAHLTTLKDWVFATNYLRKSGFDIDGLIDAGLAIDKTKQLYELFKQSL